MDVNGLSASTFIPQVLLVPSMDPEDSSVTAVEGQSLMEVPCPVDQTPQNCNFDTDDCWRLRLIGVCVDHLKRCKTSNLLDDVLQWFSSLTSPFWLFHLIFQQQQGGKAFSDYLAQRSYVTEGEATGDAQLCTCR